MNTDRNVTKRNQISLKKLRFRLQAFLLQEEEREVTARRRFVEVIFAEE